MSVFPFQALVRLRLAIISATVTALILACLKLTSKDTNKLNLDEITQNLWSSNSQEELLNPNRTQKVWISMAVCFSGNTHYYGKGRFPYLLAAQLSTRLWREKTDYEVSVVGMEHILYAVFISTNADIAQGIFNKPGKIFPVHVTNNPQAGMAFAFYSL